MSLNDEISQVQLAETFLDIAVIEEASRLTDALNIWCRDRFYQVFAMGSCSGLARKMARKSVLYQNSMSRSTGPAVAVNNAPAMAEWGRYHFMEKPVVADFGTRSQKIAAVV
jgi:hypothetical protein